MKIAARIGRTSPSATFAMKAEGDKLRARGITPVDLGLGEPDFGTPEHVQQAAIAAMRAGHTRYTAVAGIPGLRRAIADRYRALYGADYGDDQVLVTSGGKGALFAMMQACVDDGDEVAMFAPYWTSYPEQVKLAGGNPVIVPAAEADGFVPTAAALEKAITPRSRAVIVNSPSNPTGAVIPRAEWEGIAELAEARGLLLVCDEVYEDFVYGGGAYVSGTAFLPRLKEQLVIVNSFSKPYAMTGWRVGYALGPRALIGAAATVQMHDASQAPSISQHAALAALTGPQEPLRAMVAEFARRRGYLIPALRSIPGVTCAMPEGAFYAFPGVTGLYGRLGVSSSEEVAMLLLREAHVVTVPGEGFGAPGYIRLSYAASLADLQDAVGRIGAFVAGRGA